MVPNIQTMIFSHRNDSRSNVWGAQLAHGVTNFSLKIERNKKTLTQYGYGVIRTQIASTNQDYVGFIEALLEQNFRLEFCR